MSRLTRVERPDLKAIQLSSGNIVELAEDQYWCSTDKCYEIWQRKPLHRLGKRFRKRQVLQTFESSSGPADKSFEIAQSLYRELNEAKALLGAALDSVEADEEARRESWPDEIERGELRLDLGQRIRAFLKGHASDGPQ